MDDLLNSLSECYPAIPGSLPIARRAVTALAAEGGATDEEIDEIRLAVSEALTNVILHAYQDDPGDIHLTVAVAGGELWVLVGDDGGGLRPRSDRSGLGLGLALIAQSCDELTIVKRSGGGTELRMRFRLEAATSDDRSRGSVAAASSQAASVLATTT